MSPERKKPRQYRATQRKVAVAINSIKNAGFRSTNRFIEAYYCSPDGIQGLRAQKNKEYSPEVIMERWLENVPSGSEDALRHAIMRKATDIVVQESSEACKDPTLHMKPTALNIPYLTTDFGLNNIKKRYDLLLPCLTLLLYNLLTAPNIYEQRNNVQRGGKPQLADKMILVIISMLLYGRNQGTNAFQIVMGVFLASSGASRRIIDNFNHMGFCVSYWSIQRSLKQLSEDAKAQAREFVNRDKIGSDMGNSSQRIDSGTQQINATTMALFSLPKEYATRAYHAALSVSKLKNSAGKRKQLKIQDLWLDGDKNSQLQAAFKHGIRMILLDYTPGLMRKQKVSKKLRKRALAQMPRIRRLDCQKTEFFPLPALNEEEASVNGTMRVVEKIFTELLGLGADLIDSQLRLLVGDWLSIRNLRLLKVERKYEPNSFLRFDWILEASMPFHFQLNAMYALFRTHLGTTSQDNPSSLEHQRTILRRAKLDPKKPEYNKAKELAFHSLAARILDCSRIILKMKTFDDLKTWKPTWEEFEDVVDQVLQQYTTSSAAAKALKNGDEYLAHSILFIRDTLVFWEFCDAIHQADVGRMWLVYDFWVFMMRGAGCHNYGNEILEMKAQFTHEFSPKLKEIIERTWLVNRWGKRGRSIPTDLYLEHNNGFTKNMFAAMGSCASIEHVQNKSSACVEVLRSLAHEVSNWFKVRDFNRRRKEVNVQSDLSALCKDMIAQSLHTTKRGRTIPLPPQKTKKTKAKKESAVVDVLEKGLHALVEGNMFERWMKRTMEGDEGEGEDEDDDVVGGVIDHPFADPCGEMSVDPSLDEEFPECPFSNVDGVDE